MGEAERVPQWGSWECGVAESWDKSSRPVFCLPIEFKPKQVSIYGNRDRQSIIYIFTYSQNIHEVRRGQTRHLF
jgi:hypothetical protein